MKIPYKFKKKEKKKLTAAATFFNITEYPYGVTQHPPRGSPTAVERCKTTLNKIKNKKPVIS
jgi:hypothetical protein